MSTKTPHIALVEGYEYELGKIKENQIIYDFQKIITFLEAKGKATFGQHFKIYKTDLEIIYKLCIYTINDKRSCKKHEINLNKGILLSGPVGCGKTTLMKLIRHIAPHQRAYKIIPCRNTVFSFNHLGFKTIEDYGNDGYYCFDDLGVEPTGRHFGKDCNVMGEILLSHYDLFHKMRSLRAQSISLNHPLTTISQHGSTKTFKPQTNNHQPKPILTHATTNLNAQELEDRYGNRVRSRMRELFNLIGFDKACRDKRV